MQKNKQIFTPMYQISFNSPSLNTPQYSQIQSKIYPSIIYLSNPKRKFLTISNLLPNTLKTIKATDNRIKIFYTAVLKLFNEIGNQLSISDVWFCEQKNNGEPIYLYFIEAKKYPVMQCCRKGVFLQFQAQLCGSARCIGCKKIGFSFVHIPKRTQKYNTAKNKQNNFIEIKQPALTNQQIYKEYKQNNENKKHNIRKLISSNRHRHSSIKKLINQSINISKCRGFQDIINKERKQKEKQLSANNGQTNYKQMEIGQFIIQIQTKSNQQNQQQKASNLQMDNQYSQQKIKQTAKSNYYQAQLTETQKQLKQIIQQIFI